MCKHYYLLYNKDKGESEVSLSLYKEKKNVSRKMDCSLIFKID